MAKARTKTKAAGQRTPQQFPPMKPPRRGKPRKPDTAYPSTANPVSANDFVSQAWLTGHGPGWWISDHYEELKHFVSWVYVSVHKAAQQASQAKLCVYDKSMEMGLDDGDPFGALKGLNRSVQVKAMAKHLRWMRTKSHTPDMQAEKEIPLPNHPAAKLLSRPNEFTSGSTFRYQVDCQLRLTGGCYVWEVPSQFKTNGVPDPHRLWVIPRGWARPMPPSGIYGMGAYWITPVFNTFTGNISTPTASTWIIPWEQMIDIRWPNPLFPGEGTSPLSACSTIIDIMEQTDTATWASFVNSVKPSLVFNIDPRNGQTVTKEMLDQFYAELESFKSGANNAGKVLALLGLTVQQMMSGPTDLDYVNGRDQNRKNVFGIQGIAETVAGFGTSTSYSEAAVASKCTTEFSVQPSCNLIADTFTHRWQSIWGDDFKIEIDAASMDDPTLRLQKADKIAQAFTAGVASANEYRAAIDLEPLDDPVADIPQVLLQTMVPELGAPDVGMSGLDEEDPYQQFAQDAGDDLATDEDTGMTRGDLAGAPGYSKGLMNGRFRLNGTH